MADAATLEQLRKRLRTEGFGPLNDILDPVLDEGRGLAREGIDTLRRLTIEHPWVAIYAAFQSGFLLGRVSRYYAHR